MRIQQWLAAIVLLLMAADSYSQNFYVELAVGKAQEKSTITGFNNIKGKDISLGAQVGYKFMPYLAVEGGFNQYGKVSVGENSIEQKAFNVGLRLLAPLGKGFNFYLKGGLAWWDYQANLDNGGTMSQVKDKNKDFYYGAGLNAKLKDFLYVGLEYSILKIDFQQGTSKVNNKLANMALTFGFYF